MEATADKTLILNKEEITLKIQRLAHQVVEICHTENEVFLVGIDGKGFEFAQRIKKQLDAIGEFNVHLTKIIMNKKQPHKTELNADFLSVDFTKKTVLLVDDVLNSGRTLTYAVGCILKNPVKSLKTVILVNREHHAFPITADFVGLSLATTMKEHISVDFSKGAEGVYLV